MKVFASSTHKALLHKQKCHLMNCQTGTIERTIEWDDEILNGTFSETGEYLVLSTISKKVLVYRVISGEQIASGIMEKKSSAIIAHTYNGTEYIILGDKVGDLVAFSIPDMKKTVLCGHCATIITDIVFAKGFMASSDRDEKIFVCKFPQTFVIQSICVGHKQHISCMASTGEQILSGSADGTIRLWDVETGKSQFVWYVDEILVGTNPWSDLKTNEETILVPQQLFAMNDAIYLGLIEDINSMLVIDVNNREKTSTIQFESTPVSITRENGEVIVMTKDLRFFTISMDNGEVIMKEKETVMTASLKEVGYAFEKTSDEEESGEWFKRTVINRLSQSMGMEKQLEHNRKKMKRGEN